MKDQLSKSDIQEMRKRIDLITKNASQNNREEIYQKILSLLQIDKEFEKKMSKKSAQSTSRPLLSQT